MGFHRRGSDPDAYAGLSLQYRVPLVESKLKEQKAYADTPLR